MTEHDLATPPSAHHLAYENSTPHYDHRPVRWKADAACIGHPTDWWYPPRGGMGADPRARALCAACPVLNECADYGRSENFGYWGGLSRTARRNRRAAA